MPRSGIMLCYPFESRRWDRWFSEDGISYVVMQPKYNGIRLRWDGFKLYTSEANECLSLPTIRKQLENNFASVPLDGEAYFHDMSLQEIRSITGRTVNVHTDEDLIHFIVFDYIDPAMPQNTRILQLIDLDHRFMKCPNIKRSLYSVASDHASLTRYLNMQVDKGYEGIVIRHPNGLWTPKRSTNLMKWKPKHRDIYTIVGTIEGEGKYAGTLGALVVADREGQTFHVGSFAIPDKERNRLWGTRNSLMGKAAQIRYFELTAGGVPPSGVFECIVGDK